MRPALGGHVEERTCGHRLERLADGSERVCGEPAVLHVAWQDADPFDAGFACEEHREELLAYEHFQSHPLGACCGMPGALWFAQENACGYEDGLPLLAREEAAVQE